MKYLIILSLAIVATFAHPPEGDIYRHCYKPCPDIYLPVCGYDGNEHRVFASDCSMDVENCMLQVRKSHVFMQTALQMCKDLLEPIEEKKECNNLCTREYNPICGTDGEHTQTFSNECVFEYENCISNNHWKRLRNGVCDPEIQPLERKSDKKCNAKCPKIYKPICATDGEHMKTFNNDCTFEYENCMSDNHWRKLRSGRCPELKEEENKERNCNMKCTREYKPVCGYDGEHYRTFSNKCVYESENCLSNYHWHLMKNEACDEVDEMEIPAPEKKKNCLKICTMDYTPVCATDGEKAITYGNICTFDMANCEADFRLRLLRNGECNPDELFGKKECPKICTMEYAPVCAVDEDGKTMTFSNKCQFNVANCEADNKLRLLKNGVCTEEVIPQSHQNEDCNKVCTMDYKPVCGTDGENVVTYGNLCGFEVANCEAHYILRLLKSGEC